MTAPRVMAAIGCVIVGGCALAERGGTPAASKKISLRFCWASVEEKEGYQATKDEAGQPLRVAPEAFHTEADVDVASVWRSAQRTMILLELTPLAAAQLEEASRTHVGDRLAISLDERLVMSPVVRQPLAGGKLYLNGGFSPQEAADIVRRLNTARATSRRSSP